MEGDVNRSAAILCVLGASLSAVAAYGQVINSSLPALVEPRYQKQEGANAKSMTWTGKKTMDRTGLRKSCFYIRKPDGSRGPMIRDLTVRILQIRPRG